MKKTDKSKLEASRKIEKDFERALKKIAKASGAIVKKHTKGAELVDEVAMKRALENYARTLTPWARNQSKKIIEQTLKRIKSDELYKEYSKRMGLTLKKQLEQSEVGELTTAIINEQVDLIKSIPIEAGERAQKLALENLSGARRADEIARELKKTTEVTESRAKLIARTEVARANTALNLARSTSVGSTRYIWRTSGDKDVRPSHKKMNNKEFSWDSPPTLSDGMTGHPGTFPNCRCYAEPILPDV